MASRSLMDLTAEMEDRAHDVDDTCKRQGVDLLFYCTLRPLRDQAYWWRWSRKRSEIHAKIEEFQAAGYDRLVSALFDVGPVHGILGAHKTSPARERASTSLVKPSTPSLSAPVSLRGGTKTSGRCMEPSAASMGLRGAETSAP